MYPHAAPLVHTSAAGVEGLRPSDRLSLLSLFHIVGHELERSVQASRFCICSLTATLSTTASPHRQARSPLRRHLRWRLRFSCLVAKHISDSRSEYSKSSTTCEATPSQCAGEERSSASLLTSRLPIDRHLHCEPRELTPTGTY